MSVAESFSSDVFRIWYYKRIPCARKEKHEWAACTFAHPGERANRRDPRLHGPALCHEQEKTGECPMGDQCPSAHSVFEVWLHPLKYRTQMCSDAPHCTRNLCFFAHNGDELRQDTSLPPCPPEYNQIMGKPPAATTNSGSRHSQHASQGYQPGHRSSGASMANSAAAGAVSGYGSHSGRIGGGHCTPPQPYYGGQGLQLRGSESGSSTSIHHQNGRITGGLAGGGAASPKAATAGHQQPITGLFMDTGPIPAVSVVPVQAPAGFNAAAAASYAPPYAVNADGMPAALYMANTGYMPPVSSRGVSNSGSTASDAMQQLQQPQPPQRQGTGVYVPGAAGLPGVGASGQSGGYNASTPQQQQAAAAWFGSTRGHAGGSGGNGNTSRSSGGARGRSTYHQHHQQQQRHEFANVGLQHSVQLLASKHTANEEHGIEPMGEAEDDICSTADDEQFQEPSDKTPSRQNSAAAAAAAATAALAAPADSAGPSQPHSDNAERVHNSEAHPHIRPVLPSDGGFQSTRDYMQDVAAALAAVTGAAGVESSESKLRKTREMLKAALSELSATRARAHAAEARIAASESYMTKAALQAYAAAEGAAKIQMNEAAAAGQPDQAEDATAADGSGAVDNDVTKAAAASAINEVAADSAAATSDDARSKETTAFAEPAAPAHGAAEAGEKRGSAAKQKDTTAAAEAEAARATDDDDDEADELSELLPVSCAVLADSHMLVALPKAMTPGDVASLLRAAMARAGASELQVRTADVILQAQLVAIRESQAEFRLMQTELDSARKTAQEAACERDKFEVKYRSYKLASRQHMSEASSLQQQMEEAQAQADEARTAAANAWALVRQAQKQGAVNWADAMSDSDGEGVDDQDQTAAAAAQSVQAN